METKSKGKFIVIRN